MEAKPAAGQVTDLVAGVVHAAVVVGAETLDTGGRISAAEARRLACPGVLALPPLDPATGTWSTYGSGIGGGLGGVTHVDAVALEPDRTLWVGGTFDTAGGVASCGVARYARTAGQGWGAGSGG